MILLVFFLGTCVAAPKKFAILTASYNNKDYWKWNLDSVFDQSYEDWELYYIDDRSTDGTLEAVQEYVKERGFEGKVRIISNKQKCYCLRSYYREIHKLENDTVVVTLDGDDAFADSSVLAYLNEVYQDPDVWCTYGNFRIEPGDSTKITPITLKPFPQDVVEDNSFRSYNWNIHHLRSFYAGLFKNIKLQDLLFEGTFFPVGEDLAFMFPIIEQCGRHHAFIERILYIYNVGNPLISVSVWKKELRKKIWEYICAKPEYEPLTKPPVAPARKLRYTADVLVFNKGGKEQLLAFLKRISEYTRQVDSIFIVQEPEGLSINQFSDVKKQYPKIVFLEESDDQSAVDTFLRFSKAPFVLITTSRATLPDSSSFTFAMKQIEKTKALVAYFDLDKRFSNYEHICLINLEVPGEDSQGQHMLFAFQSDYFNPRIKKSKFLAITKRRDLMKKCAGKYCDTPLDIKECFAREKGKVGLIFS